MTKLSVNLNKVALLRNTRALGIPSVTRAARIALAAGADGITVHPRPDGRHVRSHDVEELATLLRQWPQAEFNIEGNPFHGLMEFVEAVRPQQCTLVPDETGAFTSDHGWDLKKDGKRLEPVVDKLRTLGVRVSLFMDPMPEEMAAARKLGADRVELYTEPYARAWGTAEQESVLDRYAQAARAAQKAGLGVNAGHDLNRDNLLAFLRAVPKVLEVSIGHALIADALELGLEATVRDYLRVIRGEPAVPVVHSIGDNSMIFGIGTDMLEIKRIESTYQRFGARFVERLLLPQELEQLQRTARPARFLAMRFAAKEAIVKAMGTGFAHGMWIRDVGVVQNAWGKPEVIYSKRGEAKRRELGIGEGHISLSDEAGMVLAYAVLHRA